MSLVSSPPSSDALPAPQVKVPFKNSPLRPVLCCGGALGLGLLLAPLLVKPTAPAAGAQNRPELIMPRETTLIVRPTRPPGATMRGRVHLVADVMGRAPVGGAVARHLVETGAQVRRGDAILEISSGQAMRRAPAAESQQNAAERSQIAATDAQAALAQKVIIAQSQLRGAQERVERAQSQVVTARDLVRRLQNGETVPASRIPAPYRAAPTRAKPRRNVNRAGEIAQQQARAAQDAAREGARDLQSARQTLLAAQSSARAAEEKLKKATQNQAQVEARFDEKNASGADVEAARAAQKEAQNASAAAAKTVASAQAEVERREKSASRLEAYAEKARLLAKNAPAPDEEESASNSAPEAARGGAGVTLDQAIRFAEAALEESRRASRDAERLHGEVEGYQRQIAASRAQVASASQNLAAAQQKVFNSVPRPRFTTAYAPSDGVVMWISRLAREVGRGQSVFGLARGGKVEVRFEDKSGLWRNVKAGAVLPAMVAPDAAPNASLQSGASVTVKVTEIEAPDTEGEAALVSGEVQSAPDAPPNEAASLLRAGAVVMASVAVPGQKPTLNLPPTAILRRGEAAYVAVLTPEAGLGASPAFKVRWQEVETGRGDVMQQEIVSGLQAGAHVVAETTQLETLGLTPPVAASDGGTVSTPDAKRADVLEGITVRLTSPAV